ncbi:hypothetical protein PHYPSEUDO_011659 [Phytophthora pseudosyringae]|uniref:RxLR effector protein n=1 Tax=Phytophthora pseudosyringae TaxID=221518 RepID=A0A8T1VBF3_9STRA|nr:hypothetical protein PHYPSEUDO_011659 [Phytophthora pseudosyringae]
MRVSFALLVLAAVTLFTSGKCNALSMGTTSKRFLRSGENADVNDANKEERAINFSALKKILPGTSTYKAAKAAKEAAKKLDMVKGLDEMLSNRNNMIKQFQFWKTQKVTDLDVRYTLKAVNRDGPTETAMANQYAQFLKDFTG